MDSVGAKRQEDAPSSTALFFHYPFDLVRMAVEQWRLSNYQGAMPKPDDLLDYDPRWRVDVIQYANCLIDAQEAYNEHQRKIEEAKQELLKQMQAERTGKRG